MIIVRESGTTSDGLSMEIQVLKELLQDLENIRRGRLPDARALANAPLIDNWSLRYRNVPCLAGAISSHPRLGHAENGITSDLWILAPHHGFARTMSRFYNLGSPAKPKNGSH
ncbi:DUF6634 family protein [Phyllobacterium myrsinacearum]|uniref:Uncharacterized protein n=1 Tax=Phyllobacterium myrsinacearum TaxID=28101 RepID=A0A839EHM4_9HYPH|nr:DUF6634 family protein [Phyllobacterium myrsinacearum]MBA8878289.1 hypothetical protein [Phyllobacterium myrsinacearum]